MQIQQMIEKVQTIPTVSNIKKNLYETGSQHICCVEKVGKETQMLLSLNRNNLSNSTNVVKFVKLYKFLCSKWLTCFLVSEAP